MIDTILFIVGLVLLFAPWRLRWAVFVSAKNRPSILNETHEDWPKGFRWIPRSLNAWLGDVPTKWFGSAPLDRSLSGATYPKPIPDPGLWWFGYPLYFTFQTKGRIHFHIGFRYDDVDNYYVLSAAFKKYRA